MAHLRAVDPRWGPLIDRVGPCGLRPRKDRFGTLVRAIISQQISTRAADKIDTRLRALVGSPPTPEAVLALGEATVRSAGLSASKARYILRLAEMVRDGRVPLARIGGLSDEAIVSRLTTVPGIGVWTAQMFLIFGLNRPDVLPVADLGIRVGMRNHFSLLDLPGPPDCVRLSEPWRPYRSVAMWYLWRGLDAPTTTAR